MLGNELDNPLDAELLMSVILRLEDAVRDDRKNVPSLHVNRVTNLNVEFSDP